MKLNCVVVDDSSIQRMIIAKLVNNHPNLNLVGDFSNAIEAKSCMSVNDVDLIFLDVEMPVISGFDFLDGLKTNPQIIFITSKAEYALKAFDYDATDYLQKPIIVERFNASVKRAVDQHLYKTDTKDEDGEHIFIKSNLKKLKIFIARIKWIEAFGDYVKVITEAPEELAVTVQVGGVSDLSDIEWIRNDWIKYEQRALNFPPFTQQQLEAIRLQAILRNSKACLGTYDKAMHWHFRANGDVHMHEMASSRHFLSRHDLYGFLKKRYNRDTGYGIVNELVLPSRKSRVRMVTNDTAKIIQSLLTRPENKGKDYLIYDHDPFKPPPKDLDYIADANTGRCHSETYDALITDPSTQVLLQLQGACDGTHLGQFSSFELTRMQIALGLLTRQAREKDYNWGTLGWIPNIPKDKSQGRRAFVDSGHADSTRFRAQLSHDEGLIGVDGDIHPSQDLHAMISHVLKGLVQLQKTGFKWDLMYKGKLYKDVTMIPYVAFLRVDTKEADLFCGKYTNRNKHVKQLCRECYCPTDKTDNHLANYKAKTQHQIATLVLRKDEIRLKAMSQQYIKNAFYDVQFGCHNEMGIHGACPMEMLHALLLGVFKYARDIFFEHVGKDSKLAREIDALAMLYGELYCRQSDREMPNTRFSSGIRAGKTNGKKFTGIILCLLTAICSGKGRKLLETRPKWRETGVIKYWILLLETLLE